MSADRVRSPVKRCSQVGVHAGNNSPEPPLSIRRPTVDTSTKSGKFYFTLIVFLYATGARLDEALSLKTENLHLDDVHTHATIVGKGAKARTVYLLKEAADYLDKYKDIFFKSERADGYFFFSRNGGSKAKLSQTAVQKALHKYAAIAHEACNDVPLDLHAHQFRNPNFNKIQTSHWNSA